MLVTMLPAVVATQYRPDLGDTGRSRGPGGAHQQLLPDVGGEDRLVARHAAMADCLGRWGSERLGCCCCWRKRPRPRRR